MRVLVTGAGGFIGSSLCDRLLADGHEVLGLDAFVGSYGEAVKRRNLALALRSDRFRLVVADLRAADLDEHVDWADAVVNEAAVAGLAPSWTDLDLYVGCNILALGRLLEAVGRVGVRRFVQISTSSVYGVDAVGDESTALRPSSPYGITKLAAEQLVAAHVASRALPAVTLRYFSIYGPRQRPDMAYHRFIEAMLDDRPISVYGDGQQSRSVTFIDDCVNATVMALESDVVGEVYNIGGGQSIVLADAIRLIAEAVQRDPVIERLPALPGDQRHTRADTSKAFRALGYQPTVTPGEGIRRQVAWHQARRDPPPA